MKILLSVIAKQTIKRSVLLFTFALLHTVVVKSSRLYQNYEYYNIDFDIIHQVCLEDKNDVRYTYNIVMPYW